MCELIALTAREMRVGLLKGDFTSVELTDAHLERISSTNQEFNSFLTVTEERARTSAARADEQLQREKEHSAPLTGIPVAIKDMLVTKGVQTTAGSKILEGFLPPYQCTAVQRLETAGAVLLGKTNLDEFAMGSSNENSAFGVVRNPWDSSRVPGGSSGGSAVAVSLGQSAMSLGTDTGGSIRQPASFSGVFGLKPTYGRVSRYGAIAFASSLDQIGPFARSAYDLALALEVIAGFDAHDGTSMKEEVPSYTAELESQRGRGLKGTRVGVPKEYLTDGVASDVKNSIAAALKTLENLGAQVVDISLPHTEYATAVYYILAPAEASSNLNRYDGVRYGYRALPLTSLRDLYSKTRNQGFGDEVKRRILTGTFVLSAGYFDAYYRKAQRVRTLIINDFRAAFHNDCDIIAAPVAPTTAFPIGEKTDNPLDMYLADILTIPASLAGLPGLSVPCGLDSDGLPIGLQLIGPPFREVDLLHAAQEFSNETDFDCRAQTRTQGGSA